MKLADIDWGMLRGALILLVIVAGVSTALVASSMTFWDSMDKDARTARAELRKVKSEWNSVDEERKLIEDYLQPFNDLAQRCIIGGEDRLDWIEAVREAREAPRKIPSLEYVIKSQESFKPDYKMPSSVFQPFASEMTLNAGLLHEEDLITLLRELDRKANGIYSVRSCSIDRQRKTIGGPTDTHLASTCNLEWYTIKRPGGEDGRCS
ncbi:MAG: hypothetical protein R3286_11405 [Gammaproteobacteria bacterium]|nr:hypothetical protein [Gammaproteobacteria bacterium]